MKILMLGYQHSIDDARIVEREGNSLADVGYKVIYYTKKQKDTEFNVSCKNSVKIKEYFLYELLNIDTLFHPARSIIEYRKNVRTIKDIVVNEKPDIVHIHEFPLMHYQRAIRRVNKSVKIVYDIHEDNENLYYESWVGSKGKIISKFLSKLFNLIDKYYVEKSDFVITVVPYLSEKFSFKNSITEIRNYPLTNRKEYECEGREKKICYVGSITEDRGILELCRCASKINGEIYIAGAGDETIIEKIGELVKKNQNLHYVGVISRTEVNQLLASCSIGVCTLKHTASYEISLPVKLFEYMDHGLAVICSDIELWEDIVKENSCGVIANPESIEDIANKINYLLENPQKTSQMGIAGMKAVQNKYNWDVEKYKLIELYRNIEKDCSCVE